MVVEAEVDINSHGNCKAVDARGFACALPERHVVRLENTSPRNDVRDRPLAVDCLQFPL